MSSIPHGGKLLQAHLAFGCLSSPQTGYVLGLILDAAIKSQSQTSQRDIVHCTAHFLRATEIKPFEVRIKKLRTGKGFSNLLADLSQEGLVRISTHLIFTTLPDPPKPHLPTPTSLTITQPSSYARVIPLRIHPSQAVLTPLPPIFTFSKRIRWAEDQALIAHKNDINSKAGEGGLEWLAWLNLPDESDAFTTATL